MPPDAPFLLWAALRRTRASAVVRTRLVTGRRSASSSCTDRVAPRFPRALLARLHIGICTDRRQSSQTLLIVPSVAKATAPGPPRAVVVIRAVCSRRHGSAGMAGEEPSRKGGKRPATRAVRCRERLVDIDVHAVEDEVPGRRLHRGGVMLAPSPYRGRGRVDGIATSRTRSSKSGVVGFVSMKPATSGPSVPSAPRVDVTARIALHRRDLVAAHAADAGGSYRGRVGNDDAAPLLGLARVAWYA